MAVHRILLVEDNDDALELLCRVLRLRGFEVVTAGDGPTAVSEGLLWRPEVAIVDIGLPVFDGYEIARQLRDALNGSIRLIALTAWGSPGDRQRGIDAGFDYYLVKPVELDEL